MSKRWDRLYQAGPSKHWIKVKNRQHPAMERVMDDLVWIMARQPGDGCSEIRSNFNYIVYEACTLTEYDPLRLSRWIP